MSKRMGLPVALKMRHDAHYVEQLTSYSGAAVGRMIKVDQIRPNPDQPRKALGDLTELTQSIREKGVLEPLNLEVFGAKSYDELIARYTPGGIAAGTFDGKVYALPYQGNSMSLFINNRAFVEAGLDPVKNAPKTWDDSRQEQAG